MLEESDKWTEDKKRKGTESLSFQCHGQIRGQHDWWFQGLASILSTQIVGVNCPFGPLQISHLHFIYTSGEETQEGCLVRREGTYVRAWCQLKVWGLQDQCIRKLDLCKQDNSGCHCPRGPGCLGLDCSNVLPNRQWPGELG